MSNIDALVMQTKTINWEKELVPCIVQDYYTKSVLMLGYMNKEAFEITLTKKLVTFFSRSKNRLWTKGETSSNFLDVKDVQVDCDGDAILIKAATRGPVCHTGSDTCFDEANDWFLARLEKIIQSRKEELNVDSYTSDLFAKGINKIAQKVGEEAVELIIESKETDDNSFLNEAADLMYHYLVLLAARNKCLKDVVNVLEQRSMKQ